jgi:aspartate aminotransferase
MTGTFQPSIAVQRIVAESERPTSRPGPGTIALSSGDPDFETPAHIRKALIEAIESGYTHYSDRRGEPELREAIASNASTSASASFAVDQVNITHGGSGAIASAIMAIVNPGERVLIPEPTYSSYADVLRLIGAETVFIPLTDDLHLDLDAIRREAPGARMVVICHPNNPTGVLYDRAELEELGNIAYEHDLYVLSDEAYEAIVFDDVEFVSTLEIASLRDRLLYCQTFSKRYAMTGWRLGYLIAPSEVAATASRVHSTFNNSMNTAVQRAALAAVTGPSDETDMMRLEYQARRELVAEMLAGTPGTQSREPDGTFYYFIKVTAKNAPVDLVKAANEHGVAVRGGTEYGPSGAGYFRVSFATDRETLREGMLRLRSMIGEWLDG